MSTIGKNRDEDDEIIKAFLDKNEKVLVRWYDKMKPSFMVLCRRYKIDLSTGLDIYQDAVASLYVRIRDGNIQIAKSGGLEGYLMHMGRNKMVDHIRRNTKYEDPQLKREIVDMAEEHTSIDMQEDDITIAQKNLASGLKELGKRCYEVIKLFYYEGLSLDEIQVYMDYKDTNTVKALKSRCMKQLRTQILK